MKIQVKIKNVYGKQTVYPVCKLGQQFAALAKQKTLTDYEIRLIKEMGYSIEVVQETQTL